MKVYVFPSNDGYSPNTMPGFSDDGFDVSDQAVHLGVGARVMHRDTKDRCPPIVRAP